MPRYLLRSMRPRQWVKNLFIYAPLVFDGQLFLPERFARVSLAFVLFCLISSAVYLINDLADLDKDRLHPEKRLRPLPSGTLSAQVAIIAAALLVASSLLPAYLVLGWHYGAVISAYFLLMMGYSFWLKEVVIIDVLTLAAGFNLRVFAGLVIIPVQRFSPWLYVCMTLLALFLGVGKRRHELAILNENAGDHRPILEEYSLQLLDDMILVVIAATLMAYSLYTFSAPNLPTNHAMMLTIPFVIYALFRYLYLIRVQGKGGSPEQVLFSDAPFLGDILLWGLAVIAVLYLF